MKVFIGGTQRSGTTLLRSLIDTNTHIYFPDAEMKFFTHMYKNKKKYEKKNNIEVKQFIKDYANFRHILYRKGLLQDEFFLNSLSKCQAWSEVFDTIMKSLAAQENKTSWGEKTPGNEFFSNNILYLFPNAKMIYIYRDPLAVVASSKKRYHTNIVRSCIRWRCSINKMLSDTIKVDNSQLFLLSYENLIMHTESCLKNLFYFLGINNFDFQKISINFNKWTISNSSYNRNIENIINKDSLYAYQKNTNLHDKLIANLICKPSMSYHILKHQRNNELTNKFLKRFCTFKILPYRVYNKIFDKKLNM